MSFKDTVEGALDRSPTLDLSQLGLGERLARLDQQSSWHAASDSANRNTLRDINVLADAIAVLNDVKAKHNLHIADTDVHAAADVTNTIASADATDQATAITLANEIKNTTGHNAHIINATAHAGAPDSVDDVNAITAADATDLATLLTLTDDIQRKYRLHTFIGPMAMEEEILFNA